MYNLSITECEQNTFNRKESKLEDIKEKQIRDRDMP